MTRRIALVVGDTLGHFYPALAVAEQFVRAHPESHVVMFGPRGGVAATLAARHGYSYESVDSSPWPQAGRRARAASSLDALRGVWQARRALRRHGSRLVIGFGGHATGVVTVAARSLGLVTAIQEGNARPGRANQWLARVAGRVYLQYGAAAQYFPGARQEVTGWPVRESIAALAGTARMPPAPERGLHVLVLEGTSRDSDFLARRVPELLARVSREESPVRVWHQHASAAADVVMAAYRRAACQARVEPFIEAIAQAYAWADFVIARPGAGVLAELAIAGVPALVVPLPDAADDHQAINAMLFAASGAGIWTREDTWDTDALGKTMSALVRDPARWASASAAARRLAAPDAAARVAADCASLVRGRW